AARAAGRFPPSTGPGGLGARQRVRRAPRPVPTCQPQTVNQEKDMPTTPDEIKIRWTTNPPGQIGPRPKRIKVSGTFLFTSPDDAGFTGIEFKQGSPLAYGETKVSAGTVVAA